ncbi:hypothetical protein L915_21260 [Phytophthora nicotianae]|uniref:RNA polymerase Rpb4/RPC9 core domain-containing protein n=3 Tax=Phytophthora nicotianae TaxID=4792 RepID=W2QTK5_PHYN3|nr:hypothetical protein PPTG_06560 [Phytophthora nicotianae INRA-310]ETK71534.1 hypothetical protein L915_21260 [Phytophthora nicotianae]ETO59867.1 hypothetical protein F444_21889 [Phytophthora nicotianae P1976]ETL24978.1 hypothetical protein L916_21127 [Phytophthora nicotianae]ETM31456.1 hypothetical protein L914_21002 [Phytophthora nicotianae]ETN16428.1 hypothetical protein PPTG_06560 [Phytophthora nicotianae INRA-310]
MAFSFRPLMESNDAVELNSGEDFENNTCLSKAEVAIFLDKQKINYVEQKKMFASGSKKCKTRFTGTKDPVANQAAVIELREYVTFNILIRSRLSMEEFEIASLSNLYLEEVEEAVALIPSLSQHFTDHEIEEMLGVISLLMAQMFH